MSWSGGRTACTAKTIRVSTIVRVRSFYHVFIGLEIGGIEMKGQRYDQCRRFFNIGYD